MVAIVRTSSSSSARNVVKRTKRAVDVNARTKPRARVALQSWLCGPEQSQRGYCLDVSTTGARFGGMGTKLAVGDRILAKIVIDKDAPLVLRAEVVRYSPSSSCPEVCVKFLDAPGIETVEEQCRLARFVASL
jgi:hypothetical protein